jgi:hypothetical protein
MQCIETCRPHIGKSESLTRTFGSTLLQGPLTVADLAAWRARTQPAVGSALAQLHAQLLGCLTELEGSLKQQLASAQAAAAAAEQVG